MAMQRRIRIETGEAFPAGVFVRGAAEPVDDFDAKRREDGSRPQAMDKETGLPLWQVVVVDGDAEASKRETAVTVKFAAKVRPVPPENTSGLPFTAVEFVGLTALPYVEYPGGKNRDGQDRTRISWSFRAEDMVAPGEAAKTGGPGAAKSGAAKAA